MSFQDEIRSSMKTPQEIAAEQASKRKQELQNEAEKDMKFIRMVLKRKASAGDYTVEGQNRVLTCTNTIPPTLWTKTRNVTVPTTTTTFWGKRVTTGRFSESYTFEIPSEKRADFNYYMDCLKALAAQDGIEIGELLLETEQGGRKVYQPFPHTFQGNSFGLYFVCVKCRMVI